MTLILEWANGTFRGDLAQVASFVTTLTSKKPWVQTTRKRSGLTVWQKWDKSERLTSAGDPTIADDLAEVLADHLGVPQDEVTIKPDLRDESQLTASELRAQRLRAHLSKKDLAAMCGVNEYTVRNWEQGMRTVIPTRILRIFQRLDSYREEARAAVHADAVRLAGSEDALAQTDMTGYAVYAPNDYTYATLWPDAAISADVWRDVVIKDGHFRTVASDYEARAMGLTRITINPPRKAKP